MVIEKILTILYCKKILLLLKANELNLELLLILGLVAMVAGFIDAIAGGGGLITLPALLLSGVPPVSTIAANKL